MIAWKRAVGLERRLEDALQESRDRLARPSSVVCRVDLPEVAGQWYQMERFIVYRMAKGQES